MNEVEYVSCVAAKTIEPGDDQLVPGAEKLNDGGQLRPTISARPRYLF